RGLGGEAALRLHLEHALPERADDPPAADVGAEADGEAGGDLDPGRNLEARGVAVPVQDERERDHAHRLLRVVRAVREGDPRPGAELAEAEAAVRDPGAEPDEDPVDEEQEAEGGGERDRGGGERGDDDLVRDPVPEDAPRARLDERGADEAADQRMRRARREAEPPREEAPRDRTGER